MHLLFAQVGSLYIVNIQQCYFNALRLRKYLRKFIVKIYIFYELLSSYVKKRGALLTVYVSVYMVLNRKDNGSRLISVDYHTKYVFGANAEAKERILQISYTYGVG